MIPIDYEERVYAGVLGKTVAERIGAQISIDGWAMVAPGDPELAAELAWKAASVSARWRAARSPTSSNRAASMPSRCA
jgi:hypothetical protein